MGVAEKSNPPPHPHPHPLWLFATCSVLLFWSDNENVRNIKTINTIIIIIINQRNGGGPSPNAGGCFLTSHRPDLDALLPALT